MPTILEGVSSALPHTTASMAIANHVLNQPEGLELFEGLLTGGNSPRGDKSGIAGSGSSSRGSEGCLHRTGSHGSDTFAATSSRVDRSCTGDSSQDESLSDGDRSFCSADGSFLTGDCSAGGRDCSSSGATDEQIDEFVISISESRNGGEGGSSGSSDGEGESNGQVGAAFAAISCRNMVIRLSKLCLPSILIRYTDCTPAQVHTSNRFLCCCAQPQRSTEAPRRSQLFQLVPCRAQTESPAAATQLNHPRGNHLRQVLKHTLG